MVVIWGDFLQRMTRILAATFENGADPSGTDRGLNLRLLGHSCNQLSRGVQRLAADPQL